MSTPDRPFRFSVSLPTDFRDVAAWQANVRRLEQLGFHAAVMADHFTDGYDAEPMVLLTAAAMCTERLHLVTGVLGNDYRHPVLVHRMAATLDALSGGRFVLGIGAGWMTSDYTALATVADPPGTRVDRLEESIAVIRGLFGAEAFSFSGTHYRVHELNGLPKPISVGGPPVFIGGGRPRVLRLAGRVADVVGINASLRAGELGRHAIVELTNESAAQKIEWVREGAEAAGRDFTREIELEMNHWLVRLTSTDAEARSFLERMAARFDVTAELLEEQPGVLVGTLSHCVDRLEHKRATLGINRIHLDAGFAPKDVDSLGPLVAALADR